MDDPKGPIVVPDRQVGDVLWGYTHVKEPGIPLCPCLDPGNFFMAKQGPGPLDVVLVCWCGSTNAGRFESEEERAEMVARYRRG